MVPSQQALFEGERRLKLGSRAFDILRVLVQRAGALVSKDELIAEAWPNVSVEEIDAARPRGGTAQSVERWWQWRPLYHQCHRARL